MRIDWLPHRSAFTLRLRRVELSIKLTVVGRLGFGAFAGMVFVAAASAQTAPAGGAPGPSPARTAIDARKASFTLIGGNFRPLGLILKGAAPFDSAEVVKRANRLAFLAGLLDESFPDVSNVGEPDTKAKADLWADRADFDAKLKTLQTDIATLVTVSATENSATDGFKAAVAAVGQDCKGCHDKYRIQ